MRHKKTIQRKCVVCGKKLTIKIAHNGKYDKGHYFGVMKIPIKGTGKYVKTGKFKFGKMEGNVVKWTGKKKEVEYWECEKCFNEE
jgi:hypothetical protein